MGNNKTNPAPQWSVREELVVAKLKEQLEENAAKFDQMQQNQSYEEFEVATKELESLTAQYKQLSSQHPDKLKTFDPDEPRVAKAVDPDNTNKDSIEDEASEEKNKPKAPDNSPTPKKEEKKSDIGSGLYDSLVLATQQRGMITNVAAAAWHVTPQSVKNTIQDKVSAVGNTIAQAPKAVMAKGQQIAEQVMSKISPTPKGPKAKINEENEIEMTEFSVRKKEPEASPENDHGHKNKAP